MRGAAIALVGLVAACGGGTGVDIDIFVPSGAAVDRVEVWVAYDQCSDCPPGIGWAPMARADGDIFYLRDETVIAAEGRGDRWVMHLDVVPGFGDPTSITFVGFSGANVTAIKQLPYPHVSVSEVAIWHVFLDPADPPLPDSRIPPTDPARDHRALVWARGPTVEIAKPTGCLVHQKWDGTMWKTQFVVPNTDPDCDGFPLQTECNPFWFQFKPMQNACVRDISVGMSTTACTLGISACADGVTSNKACDHEANGLTSCLPDVICDKCSGVVPVEACTAAAARDAHLANTLFHFDCTFDSASGGGPCPDAPDTVQLPYSGTRLCGAPLLMHYLDKPFSEPQASLTFGTAPIQATFIASYRPMQPCVVDLSWISGTTNGFKDGVLFVLEVPYDNGTRAFYPIEVKPTGSTSMCTSTTPRICLPSAPTANDGVQSCSNLN